MSDDERAALQATIDYLSLSPRDLADLADALTPAGMSRLQRALKTAHHVLRERLHEIETVSTTEE